MKVVVGLLIVAVLGVVAAAQPGGPLPDTTESQRDQDGLLPGQAAFEREVKTATEQFERATLRYDEGTERARLNYVKALEDHLDDLSQADSRAPAFRQELARVRSLSFHAPEFEYTTYQWENNAAPVKMIHKSEGFCYLADIGGAFDGGGEVAKVYIADDGYWYLHGSTANGFMVIRAIAVKMSRSTFHGRK